MIEWLYVIAGFLFALVVGGLIADMLGSSVSEGKRHARAKRGNK